MLIETYHLSRRTLKLHNIFELTKKTRAVEQIQNCWLRHLAFKVQGSGEAKDHGQCVLHYEMGATAPPYANTSTYATVGGENSSGGGSGCRPGSLRMANPANCTSSTNSINSAGASVSAGGRFVPAPAVHASSSSNLGSRPHQAGAREGKGKERSASLWLSGVSYMKGLLGHPKPTNAAIPLPLTTSSATTSITAHASSDRVISGKITPSAGAGAGAGSGARARARVGARVTPPELHEFFSDDEDNGSSEDEEEEEEEVEEEDEEEVNATTAACGSAGRGIGGSDSDNDSAVS